MPIERLAGGSDIGSQLVEAVDQELQAPGLELARVLALELTEKAEVGFEAEPQGHDVVREVAHATAGVARGCKQAVAGARTF